MRSKIQLPAAGVVMLGLLLTSACHSGSDNNAEAANGESPGLLGKLTHREKPITIPEQTPIEVRLVDLFMAENDVLKGPHRFTDCSQRSPILKNCRRKYPRPSPILSATQCNFEFESRLPPLITIHPKIRAMA